MDRVMRRVIDPITRKNGRYALVGWPIEDIGALLSASALTLRAACGGFLVPLESAAALSLGRPHDTASEFHGVPIQ
jgi:hypothetical protein